MINHLVLINQGRPEGGVRPRFSYESDLDLISHGGILMRLSLICNPVRGVFYNGDLKIKNFVEIDFCL